MGRCVKGKLFFFLYKGALFALTPFLKLWIFWRVLTGKEDPTRMQERFGKTSYKKVEKGVFWFHGVSIGEVLTFLPLLDFFHKKYPAQKFLVTSGTRGAADILEKKLPDRCFHQYMPLDHPRWVRRFLSAWSPAVCFWTEADFWPVLLAETNKKCPLFLLNGRLSEKSFNFWRKIPGVFQSILRSFIKIFPQTEEDRQRFSFFGVKNVELLGNLKYAFSLDLPNKISKQKMEDILSKRPYWVASNTHKGEEEIVLEIHQSLKKRLPELLLILIPRHPHRVSKEIVPLLRDRGLSYGIRSQESYVADENVYVVDTFGEVPSFYKESGIVFLGGSFDPNVGGHNILEPLRAYAWVVVGPFLKNNQSLVEDAVGEGVLKQVTNPEELESFVATKLLHSVKTNQEAIGSFLTGADVLQKYVHAIESVLEK